MALTVRDLLRARLGVPTSPQVNRAASSVGTTAATVLRNDPSRVSFVLVNLGAFVVFVVLRGEPSSTNGLRVEPNGGTLIVGWEDDGEMVAWEWRAVAVGGTSALLVLENIMATGPEAMGRGAA